MRHKSMTHTDFHKAKAFRRLRNAIGHQVVQFDDVELNFQDKMQRSAYKIIEAERIMPPQLTAQPATNLQHRYCLCLQSGSSSPTPSTCRKNQLQAPLHRSVANDWPHSARSAHIHPCKRSRWDTVQSMLGRWRRNSGDLRLQLLCLHQHQMAVEESGWKPK